jgi:hypothetical protein
VSIRFLGHVCTLAVVPGGWVSHREVGVIAYSYDRA